MSDFFTSLAAGTSRPATGAPSTQSGAGGETAVRVIDPSPDLSRLTTGDSLRGTIVGKDDHGHLMVRTRLGVLTLAAPRPLPVGTEVVLQVRAIGPQVILNLLPLDTGGTTAAAPGQAVGQLQGQGALQGPQAAAPTPALPANPSDLVQRGQVLRAVLHAAPPLPSLAGLPTAQPGTELLARVLALGVHTTPAAAQAAGSQAAGAAPAVATPGSGTAPAGTPPAGTPLAGAPLTGGSLPQTSGAAPVAGGSGIASHGGPGGSQGTLAPGAPTVPGAVPTPLESAVAAPGLRLAPQVPVATSGHSLAAALQGAGSEAAAKAAGTLPAMPQPAAPLFGAGTAPAAAEAGTAALRLTGLVTAATSSGQPILHTPLGTLTLDTRAALPVGTSLALEIALPATAEGSGAAALAPAWPSLDSLEETLFHGLPAAQTEAVARALPQVGPRLASGVLFFLSALNQGSVGGWLARAGVNAERGERSALIERLGHEFAGLSHRVETATGEWRFVNLPLWSDQGLRELRCFYRHQEQARRPGEDGEKATRFVLELELQRHGELQLDGLVRSRLFDLVLRSRHPLPAMVRGDLLALFEETNAIGGYTGRLSFQASTDWTQLLAARQETAPREGLNI